MSLLSAGTSFLLVLLLTVFSVSGVHRLTVIPDTDSTLKISRNPVEASDCTVCLGSGRWQRCRESLLLTGSTPLSVEFKCSRPQDVFNVEIIRNIDCSTQCRGNIVQDDSGSHSLLDFSRKFTWNLKTSRTKAFRIDFTQAGLRQIDPASHCPDKHTYTLQAFESTRPVFVGMYCLMGTITSAQVLNQGSFSVDVPAGEELRYGLFEVSIGEEIKSLAKIQLALPEGTSSLDLFSPNYPDSFPDDDVMEWHFQVPDKHEASVQFLDLTEPHCLKKETAVEYHSTSQGALVRRLTDAQPVQNRETFSLTLRNCEMDRRRAGSPGLSLKMKVSASRTSSAVSCQVDMRRWKGLGLYIEKLRPASDCEMKMNDATQDKITVPTDRVTLFTFQDCFPEDVQVIGKRFIACSRLSDCPKAPVPLTLPVLPSCFPAPLSSMTWALRPPVHGAVELRSNAAAISQSLPGQLCNDSIIIKVTEDGGSSIGHFCPQGPIQKFQIHTNASVTISSTEGRALRMSSQPLLAASFKEEISERYIFTVSPKKGIPVLLGTPGWPLGMKSYSTASWIVSVPPKMEAHLMFVNLSQPKCSNGHTNIRVQRHGYLEEDYSRREDEEADSEITVSESFYLNMSNCMPERGEEFSVITKITLQKSKNLLLTVILSVVAALVVIFVVVLAVVCVVIRKKKKKLSHEVSIYNPNGTSFLPGPNGFPTSQENESPVYATIEDTLVYTHLLKRGAEMGIYKDFDTYHSITQPTASHRPPISMDAEPGKLEVSDHQPFQKGPPLPNRPASHTKSMVDNELYQGEGQSEEENTLHPSPSTSLGPRLEPEGGTDEKIELDPLEL